MASGGGPSPGGKSKRTSSENFDDTSELQALFRACDPDHSGKIDKNELRAVMKQLNSNQDVGDSMLETIYNIMDKNGDGFIDENEFVEALKVFTQGAPGSKKAKSSAEDFFLQFIQAKTLEEESLRIQSRVQINEDTTLDCVRYNSHQLFKSKMAGTGHTDVGVYKKFLYSNVFTKLNVPDYFLHLTTQLCSTNVEELITALQTVQELLYLPEAFATQRERLEISFAILEVFDGLTGLSYTHGVGQFPIACICSLAGRDNDLIVLNALKCLRLYILGPRVNFSNKNSTWYPGSQSTRKLMHEFSIHSMLLHPLFAKVGTNWMNDLEGYLPQSNGELVLIEIVRCIGILSEEIVDFRNFFLSSGYRDHLLDIIVHQKTHVANVDLTRAALCTLTVLYGHTHVEPPILSFPTPELEKLLGMCSAMISCMEITLSVNNQPTKFSTPDDSVIVNVSIICGIVLPTIRDPPLRTVYEKLVSQLVMLMQQTSWCDVNGTIRHDSAANLCIMAVDECVHCILSDSGPDSILKQFNLVDPLFVKPPPGQPTLIDAVGQQLARRHTDSEIYESALYLLTCLAVDCDQAEKVLATFGGHLVIMLCSFERRESVLDVLYQLVLAAPEPFALAVKNYEVVEVLFGLLPRLKQRSDHPMIGVLCGDSPSVYNISMVHKCVTVLECIAETTNPRVPGFLFTSAFTLEHVTIIELLLHILCEEIKSERLYEQHPLWGPAGNLNEDLKKLLDTISKIHLSERPPNNTSRVISECAQDLLRRWDPAITSAIKQANESTEIEIEITSDDLLLPPYWFDSITAKITVKMIPRWSRHKKDQRDQVVPLIATIDDFERLAEHYFRFPVMIQHLSGGGPSVEGTFVRIENDHDLQHLLRAKASEKDQSTPIVLFVHAKDPILADMLETRAGAEGKAEKEIKALPSKIEAIHEMRNNNEKLGLIIDNRVLGIFYDKFKLQGDKTDITKESFTTAVQALGTDPLVGAAFQKLTNEQINAMFTSFDTDGSGTISLQEMSIGMARLMVGDEDEKLRAAFRAYDKDESGTLDKEEVIQMVKVAVGGNIHLTAFIDGIFTGKESISFEEFRDLVKGKDGKPGLLPLDSLWRVGIETPRKIVDGSGNGGNRRDGGGGRGGYGRQGFQGQTGGSGGGGFRQNQNTGGWGGSGQASGGGGGGAGNTGGGWGRGGGGGGGFGGRNNNNNFGQQQGNGGGRSGSRGRGGNPFGNAQQAGGGSQRR